MTDEELKVAMAEKSYGYGKWEAHHWFVGPEQGMTNEAELTARIKAWERLEKLDLDDCKKFHEEIPILKWHRRQNGEDALQATWKALILTLLAYRDEVAIEEDEETIEAKVLKCQREEWGRCDSDTCVIELSGLAAKSHKVRRTTYQGLLEKRIKEIATKIREHGPDFVVLYGGGRSGSCRKAWRAFIRSAKVEPYLLFEIAGQDSSLLIKAPHPKAPIQGNTHEAWIKLGRRLREMKAA